MQIGITTKFRLMEDKKRGAGKGAPGNGLIKGWRQSKLKMRKNCF